MSTEETRRRLLQAAVATLVEDGIGGLSARNVGARADCNPALIYYHFENLDGLLKAAVEYASDQRFSIYRERLEGVDSLAGLAVVARELHKEDRALGNLGIMTQLFAATRTHPLIAEVLRERFRLFQREVAATIDRLFVGTPIEGILDTDKLAWTVSAGFVGIELIDTVLDEEETGALDTLEAVSSIIDAVLETGRLSGAVIRRRLRAKA